MDLSVLESMVKTSIPLKRVTFQSCNIIINEDKVINRKEFSINPQWFQDTRTESKGLGVFGSILNTYNEELNWDKMQSPTDSWYTSCKQFHGEG
jgi:hypothetical protein